MLYPKNKSKKLDLGLFNNPTAEYRGAPFWAWNCKLDKAVLMRQIEYLKEMGFGGFHIHSRAGMGTEYLSDEFMKLVKACRDKAESENMLTFLYDEDRWPSGAAGGYVTKNKAYRAKTLVFSETPTAFYEKSIAVKNGLPYLIAVFDITLDEAGKLTSYKRINENEIAQGVKRYAYVKTAEDSGWYNGQAYIDVMCPDAVREFIHITYDAYKAAVGESFGKSINAIFTDEPQLAAQQMLSTASGHTDAQIPWTTDFSETFAAAYGEAVTDKIPEIFYDMAHGVSQTRYRYHDHACERFARSFSDQCGKWCSENGIALTGHVMNEPNLSSQTRSLGEAMRLYRGFEIPGIDMLGKRVEITTAKQAQSAVHQYGREAMLSELYGVTNWDFDFRGHKFHGDWQAALGVTVRVPHLSWVSMKGSAKRDYPASISYQSPWYKKYSYIENHFARLNTVLTRGKSLSSTAVIHPIESYWMYYGPYDTSYITCEKIDDNFRNITDWLLSGMIDFDFISESLLPSLCGDVSDFLSVGEMKYKTVIIPDCKTLRSTTLEILTRFSAAGGRLVFIGECPKYIDGAPDDSVKMLYERSEHISFDRASILEGLSDCRTAELFSADGKPYFNMLHTLRCDGDVRWLFLAHFRWDNNVDVSSCEDCTIVLKGEYIPELYNTVTAQREAVQFEVKNGRTYIYKKIYSYDSILLRLESGIGKNITIQPTTVPDKVLTFKKPVSYALSEDNVYLLDMAFYSLDDGEFNECEEILRIDEKCRAVLSYPKANGRDTQPWVIPDESPTHFVYLRFFVESQINTDNIFIALEEATRLSLNSNNAELSACGYYVDESIKKFRLGKLCKGTNIIDVTVPITKRIGLENMYLLGSFGVSVCGCEKTVTLPVNSLSFCDAAKQGLAFYGGNITYKTVVETSNCTLCVRTSRYRGAAVEVSIDGSTKMSVFPPYELYFENLSAGTHTIEFTVYGNRVNTFGAVHNCGYSINYGPAYWYSDKEEWCYEYQLKEIGILSSPVIEIFNTTPSCN